MYWLLLSKYEYLLVYVIVGEIQSFCELKKIRYEQKCVFTVLMDVIWL